MSSKNKIFLLLLLTAIIGTFLYTYDQTESITTNLRSKQKHQHVCDHDNFMKDKKIISFETISSPLEATLNHELGLLKQHKAGNWQSIRILADFSNIDYYNDKFARLIQNKLIPTSLKYISQAFSVYPKTQITEFIGQKSCQGYNIPLQYQSGLTSFQDLVLFVGSVNAQGQNWFVRAGPCILDRQTYRPVAGVVQFNSNYLSNLDFTNVSAMMWQYYIQTIIHEITHLLGFSTSLYKYFINPDTNLLLGLPLVTIQSVGRSWIVLPGVVSEMKNYFNCQAAWGAPLENNGNNETIGSHWEVTTFGNEAMTGSYLPGSVFSRFTFKLLEGSGWYLPNYDFVQPYVWGMGEGCAFSAGQCNTNSLESCKQQQVCSVDYMGPSGCATKDPLSDGCPYLGEINELDCRQHNPKVDQIANYTGGQVGSGARCWVSSLPKAVGLSQTSTSCYVSQCVGGQIKLQVGGSNYTCTSDGQVLNINYRNTQATITCPVIARFCAFENMCPGDCSGRGTCKGYRCYCGAGFTGQDCSQYAA